MFLGPSLPPPPQHPVTGRRLVGSYLPVRLGLLRRRHGPVPTLNYHHAGPGLRARTLMTQALQTAVSAGWTCACLRLPLRIRTRTPALDPRERPPLPLVFEFPPSARRASSRAQDHNGETFRILGTCVTALHPFAVLSVFKPPPQVYAHTRYVWRIRETLPPSPSPDLLALTLPDPRALGDPRLHCWLVPALTASSPDLVAWREVLVARPEVPVLIRVPATAWAAQVETWTLLQDALAGEPPPPDAL